MSLQDIVQVTITGSSRGITKKGFGVPNVAAKHNVWPERFKVYNLASAADDMVTDGFTAYDPAYIAVSSLAKNTPKPQKVVVSRLVTDFDQLFDIVVGSVVVKGTQYVFDIISPAGVVTSISYTAQAADTDILVATALTALITAISGLTADNSAGASATINCAADNSNEMWRCYGLDPLLLAYLENTADSNLAAEIGEVDSLYDDWYGVILADCPSKARVSAMAAWVETKEKILGYVTFDENNHDPISTDSVMYSLNASQYFRTYGIYSGDQRFDASAVWMGGRFPFDPGSQTWNYKGLSGPEFDVLSETAQTAMKAVKGNFYTKVSGLPVTQEGRMASGEWIDFIRGRDWLVSSIREAVFSLLANVLKVPYTDTGVLLVTKEIQAVLDLGVSRGFLVADPKPFVTAPLVADVLDEDKIGRILPDVYFEATVAGAIHIVKITGNLQV